MHLLTNPVRDYAWGSTRRLAQFLGRAPSGGPEAELWIGAHAADPSLLPDGRGLDQAITADPMSLLGERVHGEHGARLPFLMKVLAVDEPLSLQVHPSAERARVGFRREEVAGVPRDAPHRSYRDPWHKPELVYALTRFEGMAGFRDTSRSRALLEQLDHPWARETARRLTPDFPAQTLRAVVRELLGLAPDTAGEILRGLLPAAGRAAARGHEREAVRGSIRSRRDRRDAAAEREEIRVFDLLPTLAGRYPDDPGVLVTLLLNHVVLAPGEAMFVPAGVVHAYASGSGVEIMASSDNVLRAGLTPKHRDVPELLDVTDFTPIPAPRWQPEQNGDASLFNPPVLDFAMTVGRAHPDQGPDGRPVDGPRIALALEDGVTVGHGPADPMVLARGESVYVPPTAHRLRVRGSSAVAFVPH